ncbi:hypothetical protein [Fusobacterium pseudoperiodonticum]|jgi:hypothetical protein|uniref:Uncharacterized protein n=1 Tax=Fusobacterium pseudoperiodonticum TaxID=2663009 RepID=A0A2G9EBH4_9FUSO|nr:hypothetical protein [Fusobacterium pseudoperiodonticum]ATV56647.1 hypothetical protein CTM68_02260 [Fusobacterium pseudoperiodonticum]ATV71089.1 hypothetical protein CTM98_10735 [Fusobacterium pseudoperiodonticum]PIM78277.1 hypothetical protein CTM69_01935 [Fusobacterium pseudoperiodonticum]
MNFFIEFTLIPSILVILITILEISILKDMFKTKNFKYIILLKIAEIIYFLAIINLLFFEISRFEIFFGILIFFMLSCIFFFINDFSNKKNNMKEIIVNFVFFLVDIVLMYLVMILTLSNLPSM